MEINTEKRITATKLAEGKVATQISGSGDDVLEMLTMLQRSVDLIMLEKNTPPAVVGITLLQTVEIGLEMAVKDRSGK